uniref:HMA domain-containing protein n=1 Tax=Kalanchoe fedtschenkoi TaxID=63787 RepID=A0A7N0U6M4_KALFE
MADSTKAKDPINTAEPQPPNLKTWALKASIHCEGCKKKVKKILQNTPGVHSSDVDVKQQKVVVTGNVDVNALIAKLIKKTGKHAELWPEVKTELKEKKQSKSKPQRKPPLAEKNEGESVKKNEDELAKERPKTESTVGDKPEKGPSEEAQKTAGVKSAPTAPSGGDGAGAVKERTDKDVKPPAENKSEKEINGAAPKEAAADVRQETVNGKGNAAADGVATDLPGDHVGKKKKKKGQNGKQKSEAREASRVPDATEAREYHPPNHSPPHNFPAHMYGSPPTYHAPPVYTVSYNTTPYPSTSFSSSFYAMPPHHTQGYAYSGSDAEYQPSDSASYPSQPSDTSFQMFSDENPNACSLM